VEEGEKKGGNLVVRWAFNEASRPKGEGVKKLDNSENKLSSERMVGLKKISSGTFCDSAAMA
jgi:hypothetical protein